MSNLALFTVFLFVGWSVLFIVHLVVYIPIARVFSLTLHHWPVMLGLLASTYFLASVGVRNLHHVTADWFYFIAASWLGIIFITFSLVAIYELVHIITGLDSRLILGGLLVLAVSLSSYALVTARQLTEHEYTIPIKGLTKSVRIAHLSDIHVGTVHQRKYLERVVQKTNALSPDIVLITGDLFDGSAPINEEILTPLNDLSVPTFFSNGNHEEYEGLKYVRETIKNLKLQLLENTKIEYDGIQIIGVNDRQSLPKGQNLGSLLDSIQPQSNIPTILMYHSPSDWEVARAHGVDLMLSGHTHNGQIYPFNLLVRLFFTHVNGIYEDDGQYLHVSPGTGTWGPPMRLGSTNQITLITLIPK